MPWFHHSLVACVLFGAPALAGVPKPAEAADSLASDLARNLMQASDRVLTSAAPQLRVCQVLNDGSSFKLLTDVKRSATLHIAQMDFYDDGACARRYVSVSANVTHTDRPAVTSAVATASLLTPTGDTRGSVGLSMSIVYNQTATASSYRIVGRYASGGHAVGGFRATCTTPAMLTSENEIDQ